MLILRILLKERMPRQEKGRRQKKSVLSGWGICLSAGQLQADRLARFTAKPQGFSRFAVRKTPLQSVCVPRLRPSGAGIFGGDGDRRPVTRLWST
jgi:hypothetical protein